MLIPVILCGGAGTRLWPVSREAHPKPFMSLQDGSSLLQQTLLRALSLSGVGHVLTVANRELYFQAADHYRACRPEHVALSYLLEPCGRNTAPAIAAAALELQEQHGPQAQMLVLAADHVIRDEARFAEAVARASKLAAEGYLVTFGIAPDRPETGFGYIERDLEQALGEQAWQVRRFVEKPDLDTARSYIASGGFSWNSGMFCFAVGTLLEELAQHAPDILAAVKTSLAAARRAQLDDGGRLCELPAEQFANVPDNSIDYVLMEKTRRAAVVCCDLGWDDIGSWTALAGQYAADAQGNVTEGEVFLHGVTNSYVRAEGRVAGIVGVDHLIVVDTPDALLVAHRDRAQEVKHIVAQLKQAGHEAHRLHRTVHRPWGTYSVLEEGARFKIKRIVVKPGASLSLQMHHHRSEHWIVVSGMARVTNGDRELFVSSNESTYIPAGHRHRLENPGKLDLVMIEVQCGDYVGEDDIVRFSDHYGRSDGSLA